MQKSTASLAIRWSLGLSAVPNQEPEHWAGATKHFSIIRWQMSPYSVCDSYFRSVPKMFQQQDDILARSTVETWVIKAEKGDQDCCPKCDGKVFEAEKMVTASVSTLFTWKRVILHEKLCQKMAYEVGCSIVWCNLSCAFRKTCQFRGAAVWI